MIIPDHDDCIHATKSECKNNYMGSPIQCLFIHQNDD